MINYFENQIYSRIDFLIVSFSQQSAIALRLKWIRP